MGGWKFHNTQLTEAEKTLTEKMQDRFAVEEALTYFLVATYNKEEVRYPKVKKRLFFNDLVFEFRFSELKEIVRTRNISRLREVLKTNDDTYTEAYVYVENENESIEEAFMHYLEKERKVINPATMQIELKPNLEYLCQLVRKRYSSVLLDTRLSVHARKTA